MRSCSGYSENARQAVFLGVASFVFGVTGLNDLGERRYLFSATLVASGASMSGYLLLGAVFGAKGAAICFMGGTALLFLLILMRYRSTGPDRREPPTADD